MNANDIYDDISVFADPGTDIIVNNSETKVDVSLVRDSEDIRIVVDLISGKVTLRCKGTHKFSSVGGLLASSYFADIRQLSAMQKQIYSKFNEQEYIDAEGHIVLQNKNSSRLSIEALNDNLLERSGNRVKIILLDGQAGVGKTSLIRRLLVRRAREVNAPPIIHVESLGSRLFGLNQLLAASLDALRAKFTFDQVPALIRNGLIQVAIDGFDELADSEGYADAWGALSDFISDVGSSGAIILSGRDTFFDQQAFDERLADMRQNIELVSVRLSPISPGNAKEYLRKSGWPDNQLNNNVGVGLLKEGSYILRPFFLKTLADEGDKSWDILGENNTIRNILVDRFLNRESGLIREKTSLSSEKAKELLVSVFCEVALELAASEADSVDTTFIELMVDTVFSGEIPNRDLGRLTYKAGSIALLEPDGRRGYRKFPHTEISNFFLAYGIIESAWSSPIRRVLGRANLLVDFFSLFSEEFSTLQKEKASRFIGMVNNAMQSENSSSERLNSNLAALWIATLSCEFGEEERRISNMSLTDAAVVGEAAVAELDNIVINRMDVSGADLSGVSFSDTSISTLIVDQETRFGSSVPQISHVQVVGPGSVKNLRGTEINSWIMSHQDNIVGEQKAAAEALLWRVASALTRRYVIRDSIVDPSGRFLRDSRWPDIERILVEYNRIERVPNRGGGPQDDFIRIHDPVGLMRREDKASRAIWEKIRALG